MISYPILCMISYIIHDITHDIMYDIMCDIIHHIINDIMITAPYDIAYGMYNIMFDMITCEAPALAAVTPAASAGYICLLGPSRTGTAAARGLQSAPGNGPYAATVCAVLCPTLLPGELDTHMPSGLCCPRDLACFFHRLRHSFPEFLLLSMLVIFLRHYPFWALQLSRSCHRLLVAHMLPTNI
jgi:hypothetical protein